MSLNVLLLVAVGAAACASMFLQWQKRNDTASRRLVATAAGFAAPAFLYGFFITLHEGRALTPLAVVRGGLGVGAGVGAVTAIEIWWRHRRAVRG